MRVFPQCFSTGLIVASLLLLIGPHPAAAQQNAVYFRAGEQFFDIPITVKRVTFAFEGVSPGAAPEEVAAAELIGAVDPYANVQERAPAGPATIAFRSTAFVGLVMKYKPKSMERVVENVYFDPGVPESRISKVDPTAARASRLYEITFADSTTARQFVEEAKRRNIAGMIRPLQGPSPGDFKLHSFNIPPDDDL